jgi:hypothetical protein
MKKENFLIKLKYYNSLTNIINTNNIFFFWNVRSGNLSFKDIINLLNTLGFKSVWLKKNVFNLIYLKKNNKILKKFFKNQCFFSYINLKNFNVNDFYTFLNTHKNNVNFLGILWNHQILFTKDRFESIKNFLSKTNGDFHQIYLKILRNFFIFFILNKLILFKIFHLLNFKKNFTKL